MKRLGLIINPTAGMGGSVGLKGTDGVLEEALRRGATPGASKRVLQALLELLPLKDSLEILTCAGNMGETEAKSLGFKVKIVYTPSGEKTVGQDTIDALKEMSAYDTDLILFAGGDGTARDICSGAKDHQIFIGIPAGVKIHSPIYAQNPKKAGILAKMFFEGKASFTQEAEVLDIDEVLYRQGHISTKLYGYLTIPIESRFMQNKKAPSPMSQKSQQYSIAYEIIEAMENDTYYLVGPGTTTRALMDILELSNTLIGFDIICNKKLILSDVNEKDILDCIMNHKIKVILTPTGGQGYLLGRGNQQVSSKVIKAMGRENFIIAATKEKLMGLHSEPLLVDTGDEATDNLLSGYFRIITGYNETVMYKVGADMG